MININLKLVIKQLYRIHLLCTPPPPPPPPPPIYLYDGCVVNIYVPPHNRCFVNRMKSTANVFVASTVRKERILLILWSWKHKTLHNWFTCISTERDISKNTPRFCTDSENAVSQFWKTTELVLTCFSFDFDPMVMSSVLSSFFHRSS